MLSNRLDKTAKSIIASGDLDLEEGILWCFHYSVITCCIKLTLYNVLDSYFIRWNLMVGWHKKPNPSTLVVESIFYSIVVYAHFQCIHNTDGIFYICIVSFMFVFSCHDRGHD